MAGHVLVTPPAVEPITLEEAKAHLRVDTDGEDSLITALIIAAREGAELFTRRAFITQSWRLALDAWPVQSGELGWWNGVREGALSVNGARAVPLPMAPLQSIASILTYDDEDSPTAFAASSYYADIVSTPGRVALRRAVAWPVPGRDVNGIEINYVAGYGDAASDVPQAIRTAMLNHVTDLFEARGDGDAALSPRSMMLLKPYRIMSL